MRNLEITAFITVLAATPAGKLAAQSGIPSESAKPIWETLMQEPVPEDAEPIISVISIPLLPAPPFPRAAGSGHTHPGPVFAYILQGEIENQVEPDPARVYKPGDFFNEAPLHVHKLMRNLSTTEPANLIIFQAGNTGQPPPPLKLLLETRLPTTKNQQVTLLRLTLAPGGRSVAPPHSGPGVVYVLDGRVETSKVHSAGDLFLEAKSEFRNAIRSQPAKLLLYQVSEKSK